MAMMTWMTAVASSQLDSLHADHESIRNLEGEGSFFTYLESSINYFLTGSAYPGADDSPLHHLFGVESIQMASFETGYFQIVPVESVHTNARLLAEVDLGAVAAKIRDADFEDLIEEEELYDLEIIEADEAEELITGGIAGLRDFYAAASEAGWALVCWVS